MPDDVLVRLNNLSKTFPVRQDLTSFLRRRHRKVTAVDGVNLEIKRGEILAVAGESGCGKTTLGRLLTRLASPTSGEILFDGEDVNRFDKVGLKEYRQKVQLVFQNPYESMNERQTVESVLREPLLFHRLAENKAKESYMIREALETVRLSPPENYSKRYIGQLSGGERQRVGIARAIIMKPKFLVADEPVTMLDVSIRAELLHLLSDLRKSLNLTVMVITHDLAVARYLADRIAIMYLGRIVESGPAGDICDNPYHPYTKALINAIPRPIPNKSATRATIAGEISSAIDIPSGCRFHPRCSFAQPVCSVKPPPAILMERGRYVECVLYENEKEGTRARDSRISPNH